MNIDTQITKIAIFSLTFIVLSCGDDKESKSTTNCQQEKSSIDAAIAEINHCESDDQCAVTGMHPHYGCFFFHNKNENTATIEEQIDNYSTSACWNGTTTLRLLDCSSPGDLQCKDGRCSGSW